MWLADHSDSSLQTVLQCTTPMYVGLAYDRLNKRQRMNHLQPHLHCNTSTIVACCNLLIVLRIVCYTTTGNPVKCTLLVTLLQPTSYHRQPAETVEAQIAELFHKPKLFEQATHPAACL